MATSQIERIVLTIEGLKCGCCESGISRALGQIPGVQNHYVNVVLARAEFNLDVRTTSINKVKKKLTAATGCTFEQYFQPTEQVLEVRVTDPQKEIYKVGSSLTSCCSLATRHAIVLQIGPGVFLSIDVNPNPSS